LKRIRPCHIESYVAQAGKRLSRASLQHDIAALRGFLRFLATDGRAPTGLDRQIVTPRLYRLERLPRALPWETVRTLLQSVDKASPMGLRDYAMFLLIATYGLRASEVVAITSTTSIGDKASCESTNARPPRLWNCRSPMRSCPRW
jgi:integrase/recombinase XerD